MLGSRSLTRRTPLSAGIFGAAVVALAIGGLAQPAVSHATFDAKSYNKCADAADKRFVTGQTTLATHADEYKFCCTRSGGVWSAAQNKCVEEAATAGTEPTSLPGQVATIPGQSTLPGTRKD